MSAADLSTLANHVWQSTICVGAAWLLAIALRKNRAAIRYWVWLAASVKFLIPFSVLVRAGRHLRWPTAPSIARPALDAVVTQVMRPFVLMGEAVAPEPKSSAVPMVLAGLWLCGVVAGIVFWLRLWRKTRATMRSATPLNVKLPIPVMISTAALEPAVFGIRKPILLLPAGITDRLTPAQLRAIFAHELCHVRRRDNLTAAIHMVVEIIFWFHPLVWWIRTQLVAERERACDEEVVRAENPEVYAEGILKVCRLYLESPAPCVSGVSGANLKKRIQEIIAGRMALNMSCQKRLLLAAAAFVVVAAPIGLGLVHAQAEKPPAFDVASVKPAGTDFRVWTALNRSGGRINWTATRRMFLMYAYRVQPFQIVGLDPDREFYTINAETDANATDAQVRLMLQTLLAERFKLAVHHETKSRQVYALVVGKNGPKLKSLKPDEKASGLPEFLKNAKNSLPEGRIFSLMEGGHVLVGRRVTMAQLSRTLTDEMNTFVEDKTGLEGDYDVDLKFVPDELRSKALEDWPSIFAAVQEQLGLRLDKSTAAIEMLVVDHIERKPTEN